jgi:uncharacterized membrane protein
MNLQVSPAAPPVVHVAAAIILALHITGGAVGMVAGFVAMAAPKGGRLHRLSGNVFFVAMLTMAGIGAAVAPFLPTQQWSNTLAGVFTVYLLATAWAAGRRADRQTGRFEPAALIVCVGVVAAALAGAWVNAHGGADAGDPAATDGLYFVSLLASLAAIGDLVQIRRGGLAGPARIARHLWRMGVALLIATASFFLGQPKFVPAFIRDTPLVLLPVVAPLALTLFWLVRVRLAPALRRRPRPVVGQAATIWSPSTFTGQGQSRLPAQGPATQ